MSISFHPFPTDIFSILQLAASWGDDRPTKRICIVLSRMGCGTYAIEDGFRNPRLEAENEEYYQYSSLGGPTGTKIHFFSGVVGSEADIEGVPSESYLGYAILRNLPTQRVCEAALRSHVDPSLGTHYVLTRTDIESTIAGRTFSFPGVPFVQQDGGAGCCAHASLLSISSIMSRILGGSEMTVADINQALREVTAGFPANRGLDTEHVSRAFDEMGLSTDAIYGFSGAEEPPRTAEQIIYTYAEAGLPVFVAFPLADGDWHSVVVIGHTFDRDAWWPDAFPDYYLKILSGQGWLSAVAWTGHFLIHDDNFGPSLAMPKHIADVSWVAAPLPKQVLLKGEDAELYSFNILSTPTMSSYLRKAEEEGVAHWARTFSKHLLDGRLVLRPLLLTKADCLDGIRKAGGLRKELKAIYETLPLGSYVWLVEVSIPEIFGSGYRLGEMIVDATFPPSQVIEGNECIFAAHVPGVLWLPQAKVVLQVPNDDCSTLVIR